MIHPSSSLLVSLIFCILQVSVVLVYDTVLYLGCEISFINWIHEMNQFDIRFLVKQFIDLLVKFTLIAVAIFVNHFR